MTRKTGIKENGISKDSHKNDAQREYNSIHLKVCATLWNCGLREWDNIRVLFWDISKLFDRQG